MSVYLGQLGRMVEIKCPASQQVNTADGFTFEETLEGRVKAQARPIQRRTWSLETSDATTPTDHAAVQGFVAGAWGPGPFVYVSADAPVTNMLSPAAAACMPGTTDFDPSPGGPADLTADGWEGRSWLSIGEGLSFVLGTDFIPVLPGVAVTGSAWVAGPVARLRLRWYDATGAILTSTASGDSASGPLFKRVTITGTPPPGAAATRLVAVDVDRVARPALTWTGEVFPWAAGEGCPKAVIHAASKQLIMASRDLRGGRYASAAYTITEVG